MLRLTSKSKCEQSLGRVYGETYGIYEKMRKMTGKNHSTVDEPFMSHHHFGNKCDIKGTGATLRGAIKGTPTELLLNNCLNNNYY